MFESVLEGNRRHIRRLITLLPDSGIRVETFEKLLSDDMTFACRTMRLPLRDGNVYPLSVSDNDALTYAELADTISRVTTLLLDQAEPLYPDLNRPDDPDALTDAELCAACYATIKRLHNIDACFDRVETAILQRSIENIESNRENHSNLLYIYRLLTQLEDRQIRQARQAYVKTQFTQDGNALCDALENILRRTADIPDGVRAECYRALAVIYGTGVNPVRCIKACLEAKRIEEGPNMNWIPDLEQKILFEVGEIYSGCISVLDWLDIRNTILGNLKEDST